MSRQTGHNMDEAVRYGELLARLMRGPMDRVELSSWCRENDGGMVLSDALWWGSAHRTADGGVALTQRRYDAANTRILRDIYEIDDHPAT